MKKSAFLIAPALALGALALSTSPALAADTTTYQANLAAINGSNATGTVMISLNGNQATITEKVSGLAATFSGKPYPHVQHIHIGAKGTCPDMSADTNKDGVISTTEGGPSYGGDRYNPVHQRRHQPGGRHQPGRGRNGRQLHLQPDHHLGRENH